MRKTLIVVDDDSCLPADAGDHWLTFQAYLEDYPRAGEPPTRLINLCDTARYLSRGYYCSLLAEARQHAALPSVETINDLRQRDDEPGPLLLPAGKDARQVSEAPGDSALVFFGQCGDAAWQGVVRQAFRRYPSPILTLRREDSGAVRIGRGSFASLGDEERGRCLAALERFTSRVWRAPPADKRLRWEMAILTDPAESSPPSDAGALRRFIAAAAAVGIRAETITHEQADPISRYDALFIRETTAIDHPSYRLARRAEREGLVVMDDPRSILRCCNKIFLHDAFSYQGVPALPTLVVGAATESELDRIEAALGYPVVLKLPEGSFSRGVFRIHDRPELRQRLGELLAETTLVLAQAYCFTAFDWRIGMLAGRPIYACRYHMARNHWQIYHHGRRRDSSGGFDTLPTFEVPPKVLQAATRAAAVVGDGLYGVDLKERDGQVYVIEVNDNPSIERGVEDRYLGDELYALIMAEFARRLELRGRG